MTATPFAARGQASPQIKSQKSKAESDDASCTVLLDELIQPLAVCLSGAQAPAETARLVMCTKSHLFRLVFVAVLKPCRMAGCRQKSCAGGTLVAYSLVFITAMTVGLEQTDLSFHLVQRYVHKLYL